MLDLFTSHYWKSAGTEPGKGILLLMYHGTPQERAVSKYDISANRFIKHLDLLKAAGWRTVCLRDLTEEMIPSQKAVLITFDDGYLNNYTEALPALLERGMVATWFIATDYLGKEAAWLHSAGRHETMMASTQLRELTDLGIEIGSHTCSHPDLTTLSSKKVSDELQGSRQILENLLGLEVTGFAYPYGRCDDRVVELTATAGFRQACTVRPGWHSSNDNPLMLRRLTVFDRDTPGELARKMAFADNHMGLDKLSGYLIKQLSSRLGISG